MKFHYLLLLIGGLSSSCSIDKLPLSDTFSKDTSKKTIQSEGSVEYNCAEKRTFFLSYLNEKKFVWVALHKREFRLSQNEASPNIYSNNITTLEIGPEITQIKNEKEILYDQCVERENPS